MKIKYLMSVLAIVAITKNGFAQFSQDAVRFSVSQTGSTARIKAIGNAGTAIGGDLSSISGNPAGLGFFTKSEASITPEFNSTGVNSSYLITGRPGTDQAQYNNASTGNLNFNNASIVFYNRVNSPVGSDKGLGWLSVNFGASYNRTADYYENITYGGTNNNNSITNYYADLANSNGLPNNNTLQDMAYDHGLIDLYTGNIYKSNVFGSTNAPNKPVSQLDNIMRDGGKTEFNFSLGANYSNEFYIGGGIGISSIRYDMTDAFNESEYASILDNNNNPVTTSYNSTYTQVQSTTGTGFDLRFGMLFKPVQTVRIGLTFTSPTWYTMQDDYTEQMYTTYSQFSPTNSTPQNYQTTYSFHTPLKASAGLAVFLGNAFVTGDVEYVDYSSIRTSAGDGYSDPSADNHDLQTLYKSTANAHIGAELKLDQLYLRAGYGVQGNPQKYYGTNINTISGGLGYHLSGGYYVDLTYTNVNGTQVISPYSNNNGYAPMASFDKTSNNLFLTFGMRF